MLYRQLSTVITKFTSTPKTQKSVWFYRWVLVNPCSYEVTVYRYKWRWKIKNTENFLKHFRMWM